MFYNIKLNYFFNFILTFVVFYLSCESKIVPAKNEYQEQGRLITLTCQKLSNEIESDKLNEIAKALQLGRAIQCHDFNGDCDLYNECINLAVTLSADHSLSGQDKLKLKSKYEELKNKVENNLKELK